MTITSTVVISIFMDNIPLSIPHYQARVVKRYFGDQVDHLQVLSTISHGAMIDRLLKSLNYSNILLLDIDAVPTCSSVLDWLFSNSHAIRGNPQRSNHLGSKQLFVGPSFMAFTREMYRECGEPSFIPSQHYDVGEEFCRIAQSKGAELEYLQPARVIGEIKWPLITDNLEAGIGTYFGLNGKDMSFHNFEIRKRHNQHIFVRQCQELLGESESNFVDPILRRSIKQQLLGIFQR